MDGHEYLAQWPRIQALIQVAEDIPVTEMRNFIEHAHSVGPILDPTSYRNGGRNLDEQQAVLEALAPFVHQARRMMDKARSLEAQTGGSPE